MRELRLTCCLPTKVEEIFTRFIVSTFVNQRVAKPMKKLQIQVNN